MEWFDNNEGLGLSIDPTGAGTIATGVASIFQTLNAGKLAKAEAKAQKAADERAAIERSKSRNFWIYVMIGAGAIVIASTVIKGASSRGK